ncbi:MAG: ABC transporter ATP-binding protein [Burkholderiales bacterium]|nr:MAG: ABC transporter ATP-binding protein [Burkholderiales bacterium]
MSALPRNEAPRVATPLLEVDGLTVEFDGPNGPVRAVDGVSFTIGRGEKFALVGESGSGKTVSALAMLRIAGDARVGGRVRLGGRELGALSEREMRGVRGKEIAMIFQEPMTALNPLYAVGDQIGETLVLHEGMSRAAARARAIELLELTGIPEPGRRVDSYPHELSGGQRQRAMIAMALACSPSLLVADEPTTALDVTIQRQIVELLDDLQRRLGMSVLLITHDLPLVRRFADRVGVMRRGHLLEVAPTAELFAAPRDPYTRQLIDSRPRRSIEPLPADAPELMRGEGVGCRFWFKSGWFAKKPFDAVAGVDLSVRRGETVGIVGESGSGKTTLGMTLLRLSSGTPSGSVSFDGERLDTRTQSALRPLRRRMQVVFQDPYNSLSPRMTIEQIVGEGVALHRPELDARMRRDAIVAMLGEVGLDASALSRYPHEFSGGQRQRIAIARAAILQPSLMLLDEPTSALDVSVQQQVLELLVGLQRKYGLSYLFITHDLAVIRAMAHRVLVMKDGHVVEAGETLALFDSPKADYTRTLLAAASH